jgi:hypothetical protein
MYRPFAMGTAAQTPTAQTQTVRTVTSNATLDATDFLVRVDTTSGNVTITLPTGSAYQGIIYDIKKIVGANTLTITSANNIDGQTSIALTARYASLNVQYDYATTSWNIL